MTLNLVVNFNLDDYQAAGVDIDGTAVNSEPIIREVIEAMSAAAGYTIQPDDWDTLAGLGDRGVWKKLCEWYPDMVKSYPSGEEFELQRLRNYINRIPEVEANEPVLRLVNHFLEASKSVVAVTASPVEFAIPHLENTGYPLGKMMDPITQEEAFTRKLESKPAPALYNLAYHQAGLELLNQGVSDTFNRRDFLALEDSPTGVYAALAAGMTVIQFTNMCVPADPERVKALEEEFGGRYIGMKFADLDAVLDRATSLQAPHPARTNGPSLTANM